jgi:hypothetical protein
LDNGEKDMGLRVYDATFLGEPMLVGVEKEQVWWKLLVACVVYFGDT